MPTLDAQFLERSSTHIFDNHDEEYGVPTLSELGLDTSNSSVVVWHGGESEALIRLDRYLERKVISVSFMSHCR